MPDVDTTLRTIASWHYMIKTDLTRAFYQIPLSKSSLKYCGIATPFCGIRVYTRSPMGMPGSEPALEEMTCRILGDFLEEGLVAIPPRTLSTTGDAYSRPLIVVTFVYLPQRSSFVPRQMEANPGQILTDPGSCRCQSPFSQQFPRT